jgi:nucleoside-diphosphate-sugar epimerase
LLAKGVSAFVGDGSNRWLAVHRLDAARLYRLAAEPAPAGSRLHAAGEEGVPFQDIADVSDRQLKLPVVSIAAEDADDHFGFLSRWVSLDNPTSSTQTQKLLGWRPEGPTLIPDIEKATTSRRVTTSARFVLEMVRDHRSFGTSGPFCCRASAPSPGGVCRSRPPETA